jgi:hypothetical protein
LKSPRHKQSRTWDPDYNSIDEHNRHRRLKGIQELRFRRNPQPALCQSKRFISPSTISKSLIIPPPLTSSNGLSVLHRGLAAPQPVPGSPTNTRPTGSANSMTLATLRPFGPNHSPSCHPSRMCSSSSTSKHLPALPHQSQAAGPLLLPQPSISNSNHNYAMSDGDQNNASDRRGRKSANNDNMTTGSRRKAQIREA